MLTIENEFQNFVKGIFSNISVCFTPNYSIIETNISIRITQFLNNKKFNGEINCFDFVITNIDNLKYLLKYQIRPNNSQHTIKNELTLQLNTIEQSTVNIFDVLNKIF